MITLTFAFIHAGHRSASIGYSDSLLNLAGRSVLSEYSRGLKDEYGIFAFRGREKTIQDKISWYAGYTLDEKNKPKLEKLSADTSRGCLMNIDVFEREILDYVKYATARDIIIGKADPSGGGEGRPVAAGEDGAKERTLRNTDTIKALPSTSLGKNGSLVDRVRDGLSDTGKVFEEGSKNFLVNRYIMSMFRNAQDQSMKKNTFFKYEAEYILEGAHADADNRKHFRRDVILVRNAANLIFILTDPEKMAAVAAAAQAAAPGPLGIVAQLAVAEAWALAESENDMRLLEHGKKVPVYKTEAAWATDLKAVIDGKAQGYIDTHSNTGLTYQGYLQVFLFFEDRATKLTRMMDLIQINMQGTHDGTFLIREHNSGFDFKAVIDGVTYRYEERY